MISVPATQETKYGCENMSGEWIQQKMHMHAKEKGGQRPELEVPRQSIFGHQSASKAFGTPGHPDIRAHSYNRSATAPDSIVSEPLHGSGDT